MKYLKFLLCVFVTLFCALPIFSQIPSYIPTNGLVGWWPFNGNANDESGNGNHGTVSGAVLTTDRFNQSNKSYSFNGVNCCGIPDATQEISILNTFLHIGQNFTISQWYKSTQLAKVQQTIMNSIPHTGIGYGYNSDHIPNKMGFGIGPANAYWDLLYVQGSKSDYIQNTWYHIVFKKSGTNYYLYVNGTLDCSANVPQSSNYTEIVGLRFGSIGGGHEVVKGSIDDIAVWNRPLSGQEIAVLYQNSLCGVTLNPVISGSSFAYADSVYTYSVQQQNGRTYQWSTKNGGSIVGSSTNSSVQVEWDTVARDTLLVRETDTQSGCYKDTMLIVSSKFPVYYKATWVNTAPRILPNPTNGMSCYPGTPNCVGGMIDSTTNPGSRSVTFGTFNARPDTIIGINPILPTIRFQIVYRDNGSVIHDTGPLGSDRLTYDSRIGLVTCKLGPFTYDYGRELAMKVISPSGTQTTDIVSLVKANGELYIIPE